MKLEMQEKEKKKISPEEALLKMQSWCAYQERCQQETRDKLYEWGLWTDAVENIIAELISQNFINEERFAIAYAGGKFRIKKWGRYKIVAGLKLRKISEYCIKKAMKEISEEDYLNTLKKILSTKEKQLIEKNLIKKKYKLLQYAYSRGFEQDLVLDVLKEMEENNS